MIEKQYADRDGRSVVAIHFSLPESVWADSICLVGDFNDWQRTSHPLQRDRTGAWSLSVELELGRAYQFRYLCDGSHWLNDGSADCFVCNPYGTGNFVVVTDPMFRAYCDDPRCGSSEPQTQRVHLQGFS